MRIRAITIGNRLSLPLSVADRTKVKAAGDFCQAARTAVQAAGFEVQTLRFACQPLSEALSPDRYGEVAEYAQELEAEVVQGGIDYCSVGPVLALSSEQPERLIAELPRVLGCTSRVFASVLAATTKEGISLEALEASARALKEVSAKFPDGAGARRFAIGGNVPPHGPFFPTGYHKGRKPGFSLAIEAADLAVAAFTEATTLDEARAGLQRLLVNDCRRLEAVCRNLEAEWGVKFHGIDICLAPYPEEHRSIGFAIEKLGVGHFGASGTLFASAILTDILREAPVSKAGFSGLMLPLLEDAVMAARNAQSLLDIDDLLLYSAVCGTGLDTIPLPGDVTPTELASIYLDVCTLSVALNKPLTARLMPMAGKKAGDDISFDFPYFAPTKVMAARGGSPGLFRKAARARFLSRR